MDFFSIASHCAASRDTSRDSSSSVAPSAAVRTMTPAFSGMTFLRICLSRLRSVSGSLRLMPVIDAAGHVDQVAAGQADLAGQPGALVADRVLGDLDEHRLSPDLSADSMRLGWPSSPLTSKLTSPA